MATTKTVKAIVAERKTIFTEGKFYGPGEEVSVNADEVADLRANGFLVDPDAAATPETAAGPSFGPIDSDGPSIT